MAERGHKTSRTIAVVAATCTSLACGTNYAYSAWAPQFADRLQLSATQSNLIGVAGNMGMYASGIPVGLLVDSKGPRPAVILGAIALGLGYFPIRGAYDDGPGSMSVVLLCFLSFLTGLGSCSAFSASIKTAALNWPHHRGTATAFPLAAFGLSAFFFTTFSNLAFPHNTSSFLLLLSIGTCGLVACSMFFMRVPHTPAYSVLASSSEPRLRPSVRRDSHSLHRTKSGQSRYSNNEEPADPTGDTTETSSLISNSSTSSSVPGDIEADEPPAGERHSHYPDISGLPLLRIPEFWQLFVMLGLLTGVGLMTINNIGNDVQALWSHHDSSVSKEFIVQRQLMHVSIISFASFIGRLLSGIGSDHLVKRLGMSRFWCLVASSSIFTCAQIAAIRVEDPSYLWTISTLTGLAYGALFGVYPALVADMFGVKGLSLNWGFMTLSPVISGNVFNLTYGAVFDRQSEESPNGELSCYQGLLCYQSAYYVTLGSSIAGVVVCLWSIHHEHVLKRKEEQERLAHRDA